MDFFDILLAKKLEDDRDPKVEGLSVTANGTYSEDGVVYKPVVVNVPETPLSSLSVTANGTYTAPTGTGYNEVSVNVPAPANALVIKNYEGVPTSIASFSNGTSNPLKSLTVSIELVQSGSGDPSPENIRPFVPWTEEVITRTGVNLWGGSKMADDFKNYISSTTIDTENKTLSFASNASASGSLTSGNIKFKENTRYTIILAISNSTNSTSTNLRVYYTNNTNDTLELPSASANTKQTLVFTTDANKTISGISKVNQQGTTKIWYDESGIFEGAITAQDFEPYAGTTTTIPFTDGQGQSVEVFGGSVDVVNGGEQPRTLGKIIVDENIDIKGYGGWRFYFDVPNFVSPANNVVANILCDKLTTKSKNALPSANSISAYDAGNARMIISVSDTITTVTDIKTWLANNPLEIVYELATPTTFYTQPTSIKSIDGENNVFASTGDVEELKYFTKATS